MRLASTTFSGQASPLVEEFLRSLNLIVGLDQLLDNFAAKIREVSGATTAFIALYEPITNRYVGCKARGPGADRLTGLNFSRTDRLMKWLNVNQASLSTTAQPDVVRFLTDGEQKALADAAIELVIPFIAVNRLTGAVFLSAREHHQPFIEADISLLTMLAAHTALAIEHAVIYQFQEDRLKKIFHADKLATIGELAAGAAHEIRNPLTSIRSTVQYLIKDLPADKKTLGNGVIEEVDRIDAIIKGLLSLSRSTALVISNTDLQEILQQTISLLEPEMRRHHVELRNHVGISDCHIAADPSQLKQLLLNILLNSIQAMPQGGTISTSIDKCNDGDAVLMRIRDDGVGIPREALPNVFNPFYTTKEDGTGLGLSIAYGIVSRHGGEIDIKSVAEGTGTGTTVSIRLPRQAPSAPELQ